MQNGGRGSKRFSIVAKLLSPCRRVTDDGCLHFA